MSKYINKFLKKNLSNYKKLSKKEKKKIRNNIPANLIDSLNAYLLKKTAKKKYDYLMINEIGHGDIFKEKNLKSWDKKNWLYQKNARLELTRDQLKDGHINHEEYERAIKNINTDFGKTHRYLYVYGSWFRWNYKSLSGKRVFQYVTMHSVENFIYQELDDFLEDLVDKKFPNENVRTYGNKLFKKIKKGKNKGYSVLSLGENRAGGYEQQLKDLRDRVAQYKQELKARIKEETKEFDGMTFKYYRNDNDPKNVDILIGGINAAKKINFKTFLSDFYELKQPIGLIENKIAGLKEYLENIKFPELSKDLLSKE